MGHGLWWDLRGSWTLANIDKCIERIRRLGLDHVLLMVHDVSDTSFRWGLWEPDEVEDFTVAMERIGVRTDIAVWPRPQTTFLDEMLSALRKIGPAWTGRIELDVEENWFHQPVLGFGSRKKAADFLSRELRSTFGAFDITIIPYSPEIQYEHFSGAAAKIAMQAYSQYENGRPGYGWDERLGPGGMQELAWSRYSQLAHPGSNHVMGLAAYDQAFPDHTVTEAMAAAHQAALKMQPAEVRWWSAKHVIRQETSHQRTASRFIEGASFRRLHYPDIVFGEWGPWVAEAQKLLKTQGQDPGVIDGKFGNGTLKALNAFQKAEGTPQTRVIDAKVWDILRGVTPPDPPSPPVPPDPDPEPTLLKPPEAASAVDYNDRRAPDLKRPTAKYLGVAVPIGSGYTEPLVQAVARYQERYRLDIDGKIGPNTRAYLEDDIYGRDLATWWPSDSDDAVAWYRERLRPAVGDVIDREVLVGIRGLKLRGKRSHRVQSIPRYDDTYLLFRGTGASTTVTEIRGATHPYQRDSGHSPDQDLDGRPDVGMIRPGQYVLRRRSGFFRGRPALRVLTGSGSGKIPSYNDTNHDGYFSPEEIGEALAASHGEQVNEDGYFATGILLHPGYDTRHGSGSKRFSSIGCLTISLKDVELVYDWVGDSMKPVVIIDAIDLAP